MTSIEVGTDSPADEGMQRARQRLESVGVEVAADVLNEAADLALHSLREQAPEAPPRAQSLLVEQAVIAAAMRDRYEEPPLRQVEVDAFHAVARWFFNSYWHDEI